MPLHVKCDPAELLDALKKIGATISRSRRARLAYMLEIRIKPDEMLLSGIGVQYRVACSADKYGTVVLPFFILLDLAKSHRSKELFMAFNAGSIQFGEVRLRHTAIKLVHPEDQREVDLPMNHRDEELIRLGRQLSDDELERRNLLEAVRAAEERLERALGEAAAILAPYGVTPGDVRSLVIARSITLDGLREG